MPRPTNDYPFYEVVKTVQKLIDKGNAEVYQKFTCANCGLRQTMDVPNTFYKTGKCEECKHITDIEKRGCNYMVHFQI